jgi:N-acetyl-anhydromuramyl-L-alanine amidase AmpD
MNSSTIGIEMEADSAHRGLTTEQGIVLVRWVKWMMSKYGISRDKVITHRTVVETDCPKWIFPTEADFIRWKANNL